MTINLKSKGLMLIISAPSGGGKSSLANALIDSDEDIKLSISATTRKPRTSERDGVDYYFKSAKEFTELEQQDAFLESAKIYENYYGTPLYPVLEALEKNIDVLFDIDWQGALAIKQKMPDAVSIFLLPPDIKVLEKRLLARNQDSLEEIQKRVLENQYMMPHALEYDYIVINDNFAEALQQIKAILQAERLKKIRLDKLKNFLQL